MTIGFPKKKQSEKHTLMDKRIVGKKWQLRFIKIKLVYEKARGDWWNFQLKRVFLMVRICIC